jgi:hypothetical protein
MLQSGLSDSASKADPASLFIPLVLEMLRPNAEFETIFRKESALRLVEELGNSNNEWK